MSKIFLIGDTHISLGYPHKSDKWYKVHVEYFEKFLIPLLKSRVVEGDIIVHLGDLFDNRNIVPIDLLNYGMSVVEKISEIAPLHILVGNHDCWHKSSSDITTIKPFKYIPNVFIYDKPTKIRFGELDLLMMPFIENKKDQIEVIKDNMDCHYLFCHSDLNGAKMHLSSAAHKNQDKIDINEFSNFIKVFSGHLHIVQHSRNFTFVGNNFQMDRNDYGDQKGIFVLDLETGIDEFIKNELSPVFVKVTVMSEEDMIKLESVDTSRNYVDIVLSNSLLSTSRKLRRKIEMILEKGNFTSVEYMDDLIKESKIPIPKIATENGKSINYSEEFTTIVYDYIEDIEFKDTKIKDGVLGEYEKIVDIYKQNYKSNDI